MKWLAVLLALATACVCPGESEVVAEPRGFERGTSVEVTLRFASDVFDEEKHLPRWLFARTPEGLEIAWDTGNSAPPPFVSARVLDARAIAVTLKVDEPQARGAWRVHLEASDEGFCAVTGGAELDVM